MKWFRGTTLIFLILTLLLAAGIAGVLIEMCTDPAVTKHMDSDPNYNGTIGLYITIIVIQFFLITLSCFGLSIAYRTWKNNFQLDHMARHRLIKWLSCWGLIVLIDLGIAVYAIIRGKAPQEEMAHLYEIFAKTNQDVVFVTAFEKYQKENSCCGVYGPDDWLMVQLRPGTGGGGGGGGYQSLDYGFKQSPSTGHCHLTPPTIPVGCGRKMLEEVHFTLSLFSGLLMLETVLGIATGCLAGYCFYYWLDKEVIVIPEDEVSNLIVLEPESSTSTHHDRGVDTSSSPYLGPPSSGDYPPIDGTSYIGSYRGTAHPSMVMTSTHHITRGTMVSIGSQNRSKVTTTFQTSTQALLSRAGPFDANSRDVQQQEIHSGSYMHNFQSGSHGGSHNEPTHIGSGSIGSGSITSHKSHKKPHSTNHMLHKQELALGGKLLGEMHVDHNKDVDPMNDKTDAAKGKKGKKAHHATIAIVRNKKAPKPKTLMGEIEGPPGHHGQTGHLAEDIAEMTGNPEMMKQILDDVVLPVEHNPQAIKGGYLNSLEHKKKAEEKKAAKAKSVGGVEAQNILDNFLDPVAIAHANNRALAEEERPLVQPHLAGSAQQPHVHFGSGSHENAHYINAGSHQNAHYINAGSHENAHYLNTGSHENAHYINTGSHENAHYLNTGSHQNAHYINTGSHENTHYLPTGSHEHTHYLPEHHGSHQNTHYLPTGGHHENAHYLPAHHQGSHEHTHYLPAHGSHQNAHYLPEHHHGSHQNTHYLPEHHGSHQNAHYLPEHHGSHQNTHYLPTGSHEHEHEHGNHEHTHYLPAGGQHENAHYLPTHGSHQHAHYLPPGGHHEHDHPHGSHQNAHYLPAGGHQNAHYLPPGGHHQHGSHQNAHYLPPEGHHEHHHESHQSYGLPTIREGQHHEMHRSPHPSRDFSSKRSRRFFPVKTIILYKNPKPIDEDD